MEGKEGQHEAAGREGAGIGQGGRTLRSASGTSGRKGMKGLTYLRTLTENKGQGGYRGGEIEDVAHIHQSHPRGTASGFRKGTND